MLIRHSNAKLVIFVIIVLATFLNAQVKKITYSGTEVSISVSDGIYSPDQGVTLRDYMAGVLVLGTTNEEDGSKLVGKVLFGTNYYSTDASTWTFTSNPDIDNIYVCAISKSELKNPQGEYTVNVNGIDYKIGLDNTIYLDNYLSTGQVKKLNYSGTEVSISVSDGIYSPDQGVTLRDYMAGVLVLGTTNEEDGSKLVGKVLYGTNYYSTDASTWTFTSNPDVDNIYVCAISKFELYNPQGEYTVNMNGTEYKLGLDNTIYLGNLVTGFDQKNTKEPFKFTISQNYPNPFNPNTSIKFSISKPAFTSLTIFNQLGQKVKTLLSSEMNIGEYSLNWDGKDNYGNKVASGIYFYKLSINNQDVTTKRMILLK